MIFVFDTIIRIIKEDNTMKQKKDLKAFWIFISKLKASYNKKKSMNCTVNYKIKGIKLQFHLKWKD
jgi:hypothetical protein